VDFRKKNITNIIHHLSAALIIINTLKEDFFLFFIFIAVC